MIDLNLQVYEFNQIFFYNLRNYHNDQSIGDVIRNYIEFGIMEGV